jgi:FG-GAP repeat protein
MRRTRNAVLILFIGLSLAITIVAANLRAQTTPSAPVRQIGFLKASNPQVGAHFGCGGALDGHAGVGVAISSDGNTMAVGAPHESSASKEINGNQNDTSLYDSGAVYVFTRRGTSWEQQAYIKASNADTGAEFGHTVALSADGNTLAIAAIWESSGAKGINGNQNDKSVPQSGAVYVFTRQNSRWTQQAYIKASNTGEGPAAGEDYGDGDQFGFSLTLSKDGNTIAVGAVTEDSSARGINGNQNDNSMMSSGAVYVFARTRGSWSQQAYVKASNTAAGVQFGYSVSLNADGNVMAVGGYDEGGGSNEVDGSQEPTRTPNPNARGGFTGSNGRGAVYIFGRAAGEWKQTNYLKASNIENGDSFGVSNMLSDDGNTILIGSLDEDCLCTGIVQGRTTIGGNDQPSDTSSGAAYVFVRSGATWVQQAYIKPTSIHAGDWFGNRLALSGDGNTALIGAPLEDNSAQGINGNERAGMADEAGAAWLFSRSGDRWTQRAYMKGDNTRRRDEFGSSLAVSRDGRTLVVGSRLQGDGADGAGAVYVFAFDNRGGTF